MPSSVSSSSSSRLRGAAGGSAASVRRPRGGSTAGSSSKRKGRRAVAKHTPHSSSSSSPSDFIDDFHAVAAAERSSLLLSAALAEAEELIGRAGFEEAAALLSPFLASHSASSAPLHDALAHCCLAEGDHSGTAAHLQAAARIDPHGNPARWMELGQLKEGREAVDAFQRGIRLYQEAREEAEGDGGEEVRQALSSAYVSLAELYTTDCCDEEGAEQLCEEALQAALEEWPSNPDALYQTANLRLIQGDEQAARVSWASALACCTTQQLTGDTARLPALQLLAQPPVQSSSASSSASLPSYALRLNLAKLGYELGEWRAMAELLRGCLEEDDRLIEVHHLAALAHLHLHRVTIAHHHAATALQLSAQAQAEATAEERLALAPVDRALQHVLHACEQQQDTAEEGERDDDDDEEEEEDEEDEQTEQGGEAGEEEDEGAAEGVEDAEAGAADPADAGEEEMADEEDGGGDDAWPFIDSDAARMQEELEEEKDEKHVRGRPQQR